MRWLLAITVAGCTFSPGAAPVDGSVTHPDVPIDIPIDSGFDTSVCPASYTTMISETSASRYRIVLTPAKFVTQHALCAGDSAGITHLAVLDDQIEADQVGAAYGAAFGNSGANAVFYVGLVQQPNQPNPGAGWFWLTGPAMADAWANGAPNDGDNTEDNHENAGRARATGDLEDVVSSVAYNAVCECDGKSVDPTIDGYVQ